MDAILADNLTKRYNGARVLDGVTLAVPEGGRVVVLGPTGSGKTTLLFLLAGLLRPDAGTIRLFGRAASGNCVFVPPDERSIGMVFQRALLWPHMNAAGNVAFALGQLDISASERRARVDAALDLFGALDLAARRPETLSGGQVQRVALARSIVAAPRILLWDEPFTGLDPATRSEVAARALDFAARTATTLVAVSHNSDDCGALEADCVRIEGGRIAQAR